MSTKRARRYRTSVRGEASGQGFTLIEISIVLIIIGLIVGGVLTGQALIRGANLRKTVTELQQYATAVRTFKVKYDCLPGDCARATQYFPTDPVCPRGSNQYTSTCDGTGDGILYKVTGGGSVAVPLDFNYAWNHLSLSKLIAGSYRDGNGATVCCPYITIGLDTPTSAYSPAVGYSLFTNSVALVTTSNLVRNQRNGVVIGIAAAPLTSYQDWLLGAGVNASDAQEMDSKIDDGLPTKGAFTGQDATLPVSEPSSFNSYTTCLTGSSYLSTSASGCVLYYYIGLDG